jgi:hypothetical protein
VDDKSFPKRKDPKNATKAVDQMTDWLVREQLEEAFFFVPII